MTEYRIFDGFEMIYADIPSEDHPSMRRINEVDSQGKPIYECDILTRGKARGVVEWDEVSKRFLLRFGTELVPLEEGSVFTVVGNAFQHPERV